MKIKHPRESIIKYSLLFGQYALNGLCYYFFKVSIVNDYAF